MKSLRSSSQNARSSPTPRDRDLDAEMQSHPPLHIENSLRAGCPAASPREALLKLGGLEKPKNPFANAPASLGRTIAARLQFAVRIVAQKSGIHRSPSHMALGIAPTPRDFSVIDSVCSVLCLTAMPKDLPSYGNQVRQINRPRTSSPHRIFWTATPRTTFFRHSAVADVRANLTGNGDPSRCRAVRSVNFLTFSASLHCSAGFLAETAKKEKTKSRLSTSIGSGARS